MPTSIQRTRSILCTVVLALTACGEKAERAPGAEIEPQAEIAWFAGGVESAFAAAAAEGRPVFLYWGAEWCPPCHYLKNKIFKRPEFVERTRRFVMVYLDGDSESAQIQGEQFGVQGYPTVILFSPAGEELMRMPSSIPVERYAEILDAAVSRMRPVRQVLAELREAGAEGAAPEDLELLAFHSWGQDAEVQLSPAERFETFRALYRATPEEMGVVRARFLALLLGEAAQAARESEERDALRLAEPEREELSRALIDLLGDRERRNANLGTLLHASREVVELLHPRPSQQRSELIAAWRQAAGEMEEDEALSLDDRLSALLPQLALARLEAGGEGGSEGEAPLPPELRDRLRQRIAWAGERVSGEGELQAVMSTMVYLLQSSGLDGEAEALLAGRLEETAAPYYYMSWLASLAREADRPEEAIEWYRKAFDRARGRYTRFRWGSIYLRQLMELTPEESARIEASSLEVLEELLSFDDAFAGGNHARLEQLASAYRDWNEEGGHEAVLARVRDLVRSRCEQFPAADAESQRSRCESFLSDRVGSEQAL